MTTISELQNNLNKNYYNNEIKNEEQQEIPFSLIQDSNDLFDIPSNQLLTKEKITDVILRSRQSPYTIILVEEDYQGTLSNLFFQKGLRLKKGIDKVQCDIFLVGGGAAGGSYLRQSVYQNPTGEINYQKNKIISLSSILSIHIGKGGKGVLENGINFSKEEGNNPLFFCKVGKGDWRDTYRFLSYGASIIDNSSVVPYTDDILPEPGLDSIFRIINTDEEIQSAGGVISIDKDNDYIECYINIGNYPTSANSVKKKTNIINSMIVESGYINTPTIYIPHTNILVCTSLKNNSKSFSLKMKDSHPNYYYWNGDPNNKKIAEGQAGRYHNQYSIWTIYEVEKYNNIGYGGNNVSSQLYCSTNVPDEINWSINYIGGEDFYINNYAYKSALSSFLQGYDFRQAETGNGGDGVCAIIVRGDYFE